ncbi:HRDC domain-containing protein [Hahella sp. SMD15-11]|uniref:HRDC domain-containing protein n=1 Tax=Thermohahella caldifontis TaxID=3142973 RepID=A0AB39UY26_9GAMM
MTLKTTWPITWVTRPDELETLAMRLEQEPVVALDTEFMRTNTYHPIPALVQIAISGQVWLVDCVALPDLSALRGMLQSEGVLKLFHSVGEDLFVFERLNVPDIQPILDTQVAASWLDYPLQHAFQKLVQDELGVELDKGETRSDWLQRPLSDSQVRYAVADVEYLLGIYDKLWPRLPESVRRIIPDIVREATVKQRQTIEPERYYLKLRGGCHLSPAQQAVLQALAAWRESRCQEDDLPRAWVVSDKDLICIAESMPKNLSALAAVTDMRGRSLRKYGQTVLEIVKREDLPTEPSLGLIEKPLPGRLKPRYGAFKTAAEALAKAHGWPLSLIFDRRTLEALTREGIGERDWGWRTPFVHELIRKANVNEHS